MDNADQSQYRTLCQGAAMYILLGRPARATEALECAKLQRLNLTTVRLDVAAIVRAAQHEPGGIFESNQVKVSVSD